MIQLNERAKSCYLYFKVVILAWKTNNVLGGNFEDENLEALLDEDCY